MATSSRRTFRQRPESSASFAGKGSQCFAPAMVVRDLTGEFATDRASLLSVERMRIGGRRIFKTVRLGIHRGRNG